MSDPVFNLPNMIYWLILAIFIVAETLTFGVLWARRESARWTMGYFTVFFLGIPLVVGGYWDTGTWVGLFFGVGLSGAIKVGWEQFHKSRTAQELREVTVFSGEWWGILSRSWQGKGQNEDGPTEWER